MSLLHRFQSSSEVNGVISQYWTAIALTTQLYFPDCCAPSLLKYCLSICSPLCIPPIIRLSAFAFPSPKSISKIKNHPLLLPPQMINYHCFRIQISCQMLDLSMLRQILRHSLRRRFHIRFSRRPVRGHNFTMLFMVLEGVDDSQNLVHIPPQR
jgi:hypothetical protein